MKKHIAAALLCAVLLMSFTACSQGSSNGQEASAASSASDAKDTGGTAIQTKDRSSSSLNKYTDVTRLTERSAANVVDVLDGNKFTLEAEGEIAVFTGMSVPFSVVVSKEGKNVYQKLDLSGKVTEKLETEKGVYVLDESKKTATLEEKTDSPSMKDALTEKLISYVTSSFGLDKLVYMDCGEEEYKGEKLSYDEYEAGNRIVRIYYDDNTPKYFTSQKGTDTSVITIKRFSASADDSLLSVPSGYTIE